MKGVNLIQRDAKDHQKGQMVYIQPYEDRIKESFKDMDHHNLGFSN